MSLNKQQQEAIETIDGSLLIVAGAGSGKTTVVVNRIENLINQHHIHPGNILGITFTNKAAKEMLDRVNRKVKHPEIEQITLSTFHSLCLNILKRESFRTSVVRPDFKLYNPDDCLTLIKRIVKELGYQYTKKNGENYVNPASMYNSISIFKNEMVSAKCLVDQVQDSEFQDWAKILEIIESYVWEELEILYKVYTLYEEKMRNMNALDFDDLLFKVVTMFIKQPEILNRYQDKFKYISVDEFQDTNTVQYALIKQLADKHRNLAVVGDDFQSIYGWRMADIRNILNFEKDYKGTKVIKLEQNYRSTKRIIQAANEVISNNSNQLNKTLYTDNPEGSKIGLYRGYSEHNEASFIAEKIEELKRKEGYSYNDFSVLYRSNKKSGLIESMLKQRAIPHKVLSGRGFFDRSEIKDLIYFLRFIEEPNDPIFMQRIINIPKRGIGDTTVEKIIKLSEEEKLFSILENPKKISRLNQKSKQGINDFYKLIEKYYGLKKRVSVSQLIEQLIKELDLVERVYFNDDKKRRKERSEAIEQFLVIAKEMDKAKSDLTLANFIEELVLDSKSNESDEGFVKLMTMHSAKGLEFPVVFLVGFDQFTFPSAQAKKPDELEEERRLCYVGITRAEKKLYISYPETVLIRNKQGFLEEKSAGPSIFLSEISNSLLEEIEIKYYSSF